VVGVQEGTRTNMTQGGFAVIPAHGL